MEKVKHSAVKSKGVAMRAFWGIFFLAAAALVLLISFDAITIGINSGTVAALVAITAVAIAFLLKKFWLGAFMVIAAGLMIASSSGLIVDFTGQQRGMIFVAAALAGIAFHIMFRSKFVSIEGDFAEDMSDENEVSVNFTGVTKNVTDKEFSYAVFRCNFGGVKAHFDQAKLKGKKATIAIENHFGGVELYLPKNWAVDNQLDMMMGGVEEKNQPTLDEKSPQITLIGTLKFGGVVITYI